MAATELPPLSDPLEEMSEYELKQFIPRMVKLATGRSSAGYGKMDLRPIWWPKSVPWSNPRYDFRQRDSPNKAPWKTVLQSIIKACYEHHGHEHLLQGGDANGRLPLGSGSNAIKVINNENGSVSFITKEAVVTLEERQNSQFASCSDKVLFEAAVPGPSDPAADPVPAKVMKKRAAMPQQSKTGLTCPPGLPQAEEADEAEGPEEKAFLEIFICFFCEREFKFKSELQKHQSECRDKPEAIHCIGSPKRVGGRLFRGKKSPPIQLKCEPTSYPKLDKEDFVESLGLLPRARAEKLKRQQSKGKEVDCDVIEVEDENVPKTPTTPRTPKSLISQLSRECSPPAARRRLEQEEGPVVVKKEEGDNGSDCGRSESGEEEALQARRINTLLAIDISSPLGQRVKKHIPDKDKGLIAIFRAKIESSSYEQYCHTPVKNEFTNRLRHRDNNYPVTFRSRRKPSKFYHEYSFTKAQRVERYKIISTGLNRRSRALKRSVPKCSVQLKRLTKEEIRSWTRRRPKQNLCFSPLSASTAAQWLSPLKPGNSPIFPGGPRLLMSPGELQRMLCLQGKQPSRQGPVQFLDLSHIVSEDINAEIQQQRAVIYKTLLSDSLLKQSRPRSDSSADLTPPTTPENTLEHLLKGPAPQFLYSNAHRNSSSLMSDKTHPVISHMLNSQTYNRQAQSRNGSGLLNIGNRNAGHKNRHVVVDADDNLDIISISSSDNEDSGNTAPRRNGKRSATGTRDLPSKKRKVEEKKPPSALLFRCHLCLEEITCRQNAAQTIKLHFAEKHNVTNIDLVEHTDENGQKVVSIVEVSVPNFDSAVPTVSSQSPSMESAVTSRASYQPAHHAPPPSNPGASRASRKLFNNPQHRSEHRQNSRYQTPGGRSLLKIHQVDDADVICLD